MLFTKNLEKVLTAFTTPFTALNPKRKIPRIVSANAFTIAATLKVPPLIIIPTMISIIKEMINPIYNRNTKQGKGINNKYPQNSTLYGYYIVKCLKTLFFYKIILNLV